MIHISESDEIDARRPSLSPWHWRRPRSSYVVFKSPLRSFDIVTQSRTIRRRLLTLLCKHVWPSE